MKALISMFGILASVVLILVLELTVARPRPSPPPAVVKKIVPGERGPVAEPRGDSVVVLMFHDVSPDTGYPPDEHRAGRDPAIETPGELASQLAALAAGGYHVITPAAFHRFLRGEGQVPPKAVLLTFDDGYEGMFTYVTPILRAEHMTATCFMITGWWDPGAHMRAYWHYLTAAQARSMLASGLWSFGGHTYNGHYEVPCGPGGEQRGWFYATREYLAAQHRTETTAQYEERVFADAAKMTAQLNDVGVADPMDFAWPDGRSSPLARDILTGLGYHYFYMMKSGINRPDPAATSWNVYRVYVGNSAESILRAIESVQK